MVGFTKLSAVLSPRLIQIFRLVSTFLVGQTIVQLLQIVSGILLFRWLSVEQYAQFTMAFAFQISAHVLVEFGFAGTVIALVGDKIHDKRKIGSIIKAGLYFRNRLFIVIGIGCIVVFPIIAARQHWSVVATTLLLVSILSNIFFSGWSAYFTPPLRMHKQVGTLYKLQIKSAVLRLIVLYVFQLASVLNAWIAALAGTLQTAWSGYLTKKAGRQYVEEVTVYDAQDRRDMLTLIRPLAPVIVFNAFQGQILVFLSSVFGQSSDIAEIGVLSRIGQLYTIFSMAGGVLIAPYIARQPKNQLFKSYLAIITSAIFFCAMIVLIGYVFPQPFLYILGSNYSHLHTEIVLLLISSGLIFLNGVIWEMNEARKWIYGWDSAAVIAGTIILQSLCILIFRLDNTYSILLLSIFTNFFVFILRLIVTIYGFRVAKT
jgi:O-antigen/teichoic acid export membrane protein